MKKNKIFRRFRNDGLESINFSDTQRTARDIIRAKMLSGEYESEYINCPICGGLENTVIAEKDFYGFASNTVVCCDCDLVYANPRFTKVTLEKMYSNEYRDLDRFNPYSDDYFELEKIKAINILNFITTHNLLDKINGKIVVEIGCGAGGGLQHFKDNRFRVIGCDLSPTNVDYAVGKEIEAYYGNLEIIIEKLGDRTTEVGLVIYEQVFEHLLHPRLELQKLANWLPKDSLLYIGVPGLKNIHNAYDSDLMPFLQIPHLCYFELRTLTELFRSEGFVAIAGNESIRSLFKYEGQKYIVSYEDGKHKSVLAYLNKLERRRVFLAPLRALRKLPLKIGLEMRKIIIESSILPTSFKKKSSAALKKIYHLFLIK